MKIIFLKMVVFTMLRGNEIFNSLICPFSIKMYMILTFSNIYFLGPKTTALLALPHIQP